jgi:hypothetical protein
VSDFTPGQPPPRLLTHRTGVRDGVRGAINKILRHNGCIVAGSAGLGQTYEALAVIKYFELKNERVLVLCPQGKARQPKC